MAGPTRKAVNAWSPAIAKAIGGTTTSPSPMEHQRSRATRNWPCGCLTSDASAPVLARVSRSDCPGSIHWSRDRAAGQAPLAGRLTGTDSWTCRPESAELRPRAGQHAITPSPLPGRSAGVGITGPSGARFLAGVFVKCPEARRFSPLAGRSRPVPASSGRDIDQGGRAKPRLLNDGCGANWCSTSGGPERVAAMDW